MDGKYLKERGRTWYVRLAVPKRLQDYFGKQEFIESLHTKDLDEAKVLKQKYLDQYVQMISLAKRYYDPNRSKEEQIRDLGLMLRQFNNKDPEKDNTWISYVLEAKLEELTGPKIASAVLNGHHEEYKGIPAPEDVKEAFGDARKMV